MPYDFNEFTIVNISSEYGFGFYGDGMYGGVVVSIGDETYSPANWPEETPDPAALWTEDAGTPGSVWAEDAPEPAAVWTEDVGTPSSAWTEVNE
jgi:hypothetical protein